ncbi:NAD(P)-binding protein [Ceratobasidium sp. AG-Ba]|nr:NAD(P)-binding protein [Ceratobasidium sp. AG-Ba]
MPRVIVIGATGYIGNALALSLVRSGNHVVWGIARTEEKARPLAVEEINPIICADPIKDGAVWHDVVRKHHIDVVVDCSPISPDILVLLDAVKKLGQERLETAAKEGVKFQKLGFVHVSGTWLHGDSKVMVSDTTPAGTPSAPSPALTISAARPGWEQIILKAQDVLDVIIIRPGLVYGRTSWVFSPVFQPILDAVRSGASTAQIPIYADAIPSFVHLEDVASGLHAAVDKLPLIAGTGVYPIFDLVTSHEPLRFIAEGAATALGLNAKVEFVGPGDNVFFQALTSSSNCDSSRARQLLGWVPKRVGMLPKIDVYARAWLANVEGASKA